MIDTHIHWVVVILSVFQSILTLGVALRIQANIDFHERINDLREKIMWDRVKELEHKIK